MPRLSIKHNMSEIVLNSIEEVSVVDVYDLASEIGNECEKIIDLFGASSVESLIPKCITALEMLEALASKNEQETALIQELNDRISKLENEKMERAESKKKFEKEIETIEEAWRCETRELVTMVSRLQAENQRLSQEQKDKGSSHDFNEDATKVDDNMMQKLKEQVDRQRNEIKLKSKEIQEKTESIEQSVADFEHVKNQNCEIKKRTKLLQNQVKVLCEERADFLAKIQDQHRSIVTMKKQVGSVELEDMDKEDETTIPRFTIAELKEVLAERNELKNRINDLEEQLMAYKPSSPKTQDENVVQKEIEDEAPVQGPLPELWYTTMDDPWKQQKSPESGIRKFFKKLFSESEGGFPKRSLSTLTKMALSTSSGPHTEIPI